MRRVRGRTHAALAVAIAAGTTFAGSVAAAAASPGAAADSAATLEQLQRAVEARRARLDAFARQEQGLLDTLDGIDQAAARVGREVALARREVRRAEETLAAAEARRQRLEAESAGPKRALAARAVQLYREGKGGPLRFLAGAGSLRELLARARAIRRGLEQDAALLARVRAEVAAVAQARREAEASARASAQAIERLEERARSLDAERGSKQELVATLRSDGARERAALAELESAAKALEDTLVRLGASLPKRASPAPGAPFTSLRGRLRAPVAAPVARRFGRVVDAEFLTATFRKGFDYAAPAGAAVRAVASGEVRFAGWFRGYGKMVILDHGEGYFTVSAHLDEIQVAVGDAVEAERTIGTVGDTGSLVGPQLYFEIRHGSEPLDPANWLAGGTGLD